MLRSTVAVTLSISSALPVGGCPASPTAEPIRLLRWSAALRHRILAAPSQAGRVHSIFARALNISWHDDGLVALHAPGPLAAPFAAAIARLPRLGSLTPGTAVVRRGRQILFGPVVLETEGGTLVDTRMVATTEAPDLLVSALASAVIPAVAPGLLSPRGRSAQRRLADGIVARDGESFVRGACALMGLGEGLTPAGDDCLVGVLAVLHRFRPAWLIDRPEIYASLGTAARAATTMVGRDFILHALDAAFSEHILRLVTAATDRDAQRAIAALAGTGGTSGADALAGMRLALEALAP